MENIIRNQENKIPIEKIGKFCIARDLIDIDKNAMLAIMSKMIIVRCELIYFGCSGRFEYTALSDLFEPNSIECEIPQYEVTVTRKDKIYDVDAKKIGN